MASARSGARNSRSVPATPRPGPAWCFEVLGLEPGAEAADVRRAFLQRAKETHPDKGGSAAEFQRVVRASEAICGQPQEYSPSRAKSPPATARQSNNAAFSEGLEKLAEQLKQMHTERVRSEREQAMSRQRSCERRTQAVQQRASQVREQAAAQRLQRALRVQRRVTMPAGVELCASDPSSPSSLDGFVAKLEVKGSTFSGPRRKTIDMAELDHSRLGRAARSGGEPSLRRLVKQMEREAKGAWK